MSTLLQKQLAKKIVENASAKKPKNKKQLLVSAGYDETTAIATPTRTIEQAGVKAELIALGFTEENAKNVVSSILLNEDADDGHRLKAAQEVFKVEGSYAPEKSTRLQVNIEAGSERNADLEALREKYENELRNKLINEVPPK